MKKRILLFLVTWLMVIGLAPDIVAQTRFKSLNYLYSITGSKIVSGQHNDQKNLPKEMGGGSTNQVYWTEQVRSITGKYPALYGADFLFHGSNQLRWDITYESERQWNAGAMISIMWHTCPPIQGTTCQWQGGLLSSLSTAQWTELLTNGTPLNNVLKARIDEISVYLQYLEDKNVEVMWRPFHEQNQTAFWWNSGGAERTKALWRFTHNYMTNVKGLSNLIWVWDMQDMSGNYANWNPGPEYFDIAAVDIYADGYTNQTYYNSLVQQAGTKPVAYGECFRLPSAQAMQTQSKMSFFMNWAYGLLVDYNEPPRQTNSIEYIREVYNNPRVITRDEMPGWNNSVPANLATGKPVTVFSTEAGINVAANAVDSQYGTRWSSLYTDQQWLQVDLGNSYNVNRVKITWEAAYGKDYKVQISSDATNWSDIKFITNNGSLVNDHVSLSGVGRYVRILGITRGTIFGYSIFELEVYGTPYINQAPTVSLTSPINNSNFVAPANLVLSANAADSDGSISKVDFYNGSTLLGSDNAAPYSFTWNNVVAGTYAVTARATDNSNATTTSSIINVVVTNPVVQTGTKVVAYVANWVDLTTYSNSIDYSKITHINLAFENPNSNGDLSFRAAYGTLIQRAHANNVKVYISLGGGAAASDQNLTNLYFSLISDTRRTSFVSKLLNYTQVNNFDGIDVDLEGPAINADYGKFIADLSAVLKPAGKGLTAALSQGYGGGNVPSSTFAHFDWINIMAYDATGPWNPSSPGQHSSFDYAKSNVEYWLGRGLPKNKAVLGVPFYGWGFGSAAGEWSYSKIVSTYPGAENADQTGSTVWYNGIPTIKAKTNYAFDQQLGGIMIWELSQDAPGAKSLLLAIDQVVKLRSTTTNVPDNLAKLKPVAVSSTEAGANILTNAVDGSYGTRWSSLYIDDQWLSVDLGANYDINRIKITWETALGKEYKIQVSADAVNWSDVKSITNNSTLVNDHTGLTGTGRHVRILGILRGTVYGYSIYELEVYGTPATIAQSPYGGVAKSIPGIIQAEEYDLGGSGIAYNDLTAGNAFNVFRTDAVDVENCADAGNGYNIGAAQIGEWLEYTVNVSQSGTYDILSRVATTSNGKFFHIEINGENVTGNILVPNTGGWQTWSTVAVRNINLTSGTKVMRVFMDTDLFNLNYITFQPSITAANQTPVVAITTPLMNASYNESASITISANATDIDGSINKVEFFNGTTLLATDQTASYNFIWTNVPAGTYSISARATDNMNLVASSSTITINVQEVNACSGNPTYVENGGYVAGSKVQTSGELFECKPYPYSGWCNGAAWAYAPGTGLYWQDAWSKIGTCQVSASTEMSVSTVASPNPSTDKFNLQFNGIVESVNVVDIQGTLVYSNYLVQGMSLSFGDILPSGLYQVSIKYDDGRIESLRLQKNN